MKFNLILTDSNKCIKDYVNLSPYNDKDGLNQGQINNLDWVCDAGSIEHLIADDILSHFRFPAIADILKNWISKLKVSGKITFRGIDFEEVSRALVLEKMNTLEASKLIWGEQSDIYDVKQSGLSIIDLIEYLEQFGLKVTKKVFEGYKYTVEAVRTV